MKTVTALITDLDNTLWDWVAAWGAQFNALLDGVIEIGEFDRTELLDQAREVHQRRRTSEYTALLEELPALLSKTPVQSIRTVYADAIRASQEARDRASRLYPGVMETLVSLKRQGCVLVGYTESMFWPSSQRIRKTGLDGVLDAFYSPPDHDFPSGVGPAGLRTFPDEKYQLKVTLHRPTAKGQLKPNPEILQAILEDLGVPPSNAAYVGDSKMKDIAMAQDVGVLDLWAEYGQAHDTETYSLLRQVTHWSKEDVEREKLINSGREVIPSISLSNFSELQLHVTGPRR